MLVVVGGGGCWQSLNVRLVLHDLPALFGPCAQEEQRAEHDAQAGQAERNVPGTADAVYCVGFGTVVGDDVRLTSTSDSQSNGDRVIDHGVDKRGGETLMFFGHGVRQNDSSGREGHVHTEC